MMAQAAPGHRYFARYKERLSPLIGVDAATVVVAYYKAVLALVFFAVPLPILLVTTTSPGTSTLGLLAVVLSFAIASGIGVRLVVLTSRGGKLVSEYLTKEWGQPVRISGVKISVRWWRWRLDCERQRLQHKDS